MKDETFAVGLKGRTRFILPPSSLILYFVSL
jgi:hypothetical protein